MVLRRLKELLKRGSERGPVVAAPAEAVAIPVAPPPPPPVHRGPQLVHHPVALRDLDPDAVRIIKRLTRFDQTAYLVGGCVRDLLLERQPKDFDIGTSATPRQIKRLFSNCRIIGRRFRLAHIYFQNGKIIEVATFRARDGGDPVEETAAVAATPEEGDDLLIRDDNVFGTPEEDALRRDFTINALFYDVNAETVLDHAEGLADLRRRSVRTIGDPATRFREDPIRILRAIKFAARLDFVSEPKTMAALRQTRSEIPKAAPPRVLEELNRFCRGAAARRSFELMLDTGVFEVVLPELQAHYGTEGRERDVLLALLGSLDVRVSGGLEVSAGEIFAALLFAPVAPKLGWTLAPEAPAARGHGDARTVVDDVLRPIALRLRVARKDQERARQALSTLQRMVPLRPMRRGVRGTIQRRPAFADAWWMLEALAPLLGGEFEAARADWAEHLARPGVEPAPSREEALDPADAETEAEDGGERAERPGRRRRRGRRGGRGRRGEAPASTPPAAVTAAPPARATTPAKKLPAVWSDDYFFAALPSVPELAAEEGDTDRYGAARVTPPEAAAPSPDAPASSARRRSRRGGRRHRKRPSIIPSDDRSTPSEGDQS